MVAEGRVLGRVQHLQQGRGRIAAPVRSQLVDLVQQDESVGRLGLLHRLDDLAGHGADIGPAVAADLAFVAHATQRHTDVLTPRRLGDGLGQRGLADAGRTDQAQDRPLQAAGAGLNGQILDDPFLDLLQTEVILFQNLLRLDQVDRLLLGLAPRHGQQPVEVVADHGRFRRHRAHVAQLLDLGLGLGARFLGQARLTDALLQVHDLVARVVGLAQLALDRLHLLVQIVFALGLLHLALHARADLLLDLQDRDFALHQAIDLLQPLGHVEGFQKALLVGDLDRQMGGDRVRQLGRIGDLGDGTEGLGRDLLVQLHIVLELLDHGAQHGLGLRGLARFVLDLDGLGLEILLTVGEAGQTRAALALDKNLHGAVGQFQQLKHAGQHADGIDGVRRGIVVDAVFLGRQQDLLFALHDLVQRLHRLFAADEERHDHVREDDDVSQRQDRQGLCISHGCVLLGH